MAISRVLVDPIKYLGNPGIDSGIAGIGAADAPRDHPGKGVVVVVGSRLHQGTSAVALDKIWLTVN